MAVEHPIGGWLARGSRSCYPGEMISDDLLLTIGRWLGLVGLGLLVLSGIGGTLLASRTAQKLKFLKGRTFDYHRVLSLIGATLFLLHPVPMIFASETSGMTIRNTFLPFTAPKQTLWIGLGTVAAYVLAVVTVSSIYIKKLKRSTWRALHYGTYLVFVLGLAHGLFISGEFKEGESFELDEPEKIILLVMTALVVSFPAWRVRIARGKKAKRAAAAALLVLFSRGMVGRAAAEVPVTGSYQLTINGSTLGEVKPSTGHRLILQYAPSFGGSFDLRTEYYTEGSYNADPPGELNHNINEAKFENQLMYNRELWHGLGVTVGALHHENFKFTDHYFWSVGGLTYVLPVGEDVTLSTAAVGEKKWWTGRLFYDLSGTAEYRFVKDWNVQAAIHRYENFGQSDPSPTQKREYELALNYALTEHQTVGASFFRHVQFDAPNDQFSFLRLKWSYSF